MSEVRFGPAVVDADGAVLGRLASVLAKRLLMGEDIIVVNAEKAVISGSPDFKEEIFREEDAGQQDKGALLSEIPAHAA